MEEITINISTRALEANCHTYNREPSAENLKDIIIDFIKANTGRYEGEVARKEATRQANSQVEIT